MKNAEIELKGNRTTVAGYIKWQVINPDGSIDVEGEHPNLILDAGLDQLAIQSYASMFYYNCVGTGNSTPIVTQIGLDNEVARTGSYLTSPGGSCGTSYSGNTFVFQRTFNWPTGSLNGTFYELGFSWSSTPGNDLWSRSLFKDLSGNPTSVSVSAAQQLRVVYQLSVVYGSATWQDGSVNITGIGTVPYKYSTYLPFRVQVPGVGNSTTYSDTGTVISALACVSYSGGVRQDASTSFGPMYGEPWMTYTYSNTWGQPAFWYKYVDPAYPDYTAWPPLNQLTGTLPPTDGSTSYSNATYTLGTFYIDRTISFDVNTANGNIQWFLSGPSQYMACPDVYFLPTPISKDNLHTLTITFRQSWGRA